MLCHNRRGAVNFGTEASFVHNGGDGRNLAPDAEAGMASASCCRQRSGIACAEGDEHDPGQNVDHRTSASIAFAAAGVLPARSTEPDDLAMSRPLRLLLVQDSEADAAFVTDLLGKTGHRVAALRVAGEDGLRAALTQGPWDIALCSHRGSGLAVERALAILHATGVDLPVFVLCERFEETEAVGLMRAGARDCLPWDGMARLVPAIERELASTDVRRRLSESVRRYRGMLANLNDALIIDDISGRVVFANERFLELFGIGHAALDHLVLEDYVAPEYRTLLRERHDRRIAGETVPDRFEYEGLRGDGTRVWLEVRVSPVLENGALIGTQSIIQDIGERKLSEQTQTALRKSPRRHWPPPICRSCIGAFTGSSMRCCRHRISTWPSTTGARTWSSSRISSTSTIPSRRRRSWARSA